MLQVRLLCLGVSAVALTAFLVQYRRRRLLIQCSHCQHDCSEPPETVLAASSVSPAKEQKQKRQPRQQLNPRFFAARNAEGNLAINPRFLDAFLRWDCGRQLLGMGLFPNAQEITESMACLETIRERLPEVKFTSDDVVVVVIGDGRSPRTAALMALRTRWNVLSIDPALHGLEQTGITERTMQSDYATLPKELKHSKLEQQETTRQGTFSAE